MQSSKCIATGSVEAVGFRHVPAANGHPPLRIFHPSKSGGQPVGFFQDSSAAYYLQGYWSACMDRKRESLLYKVGLFVIPAFAWLLPLNYLKIPGVYLEAPIANTP